MPGAFISYRREDSAGYAGRLFDILSSRIGREHTFMDIDAIEGGDTFSKVIAQKIDSSNVLLALIGPRWLSVTGGNGVRRLDDTRDFVRLEIGRGLERGIRVIPVLVGGATVPLAHQLPEELRPLAERQAIEIRDTDFHIDAQQLADVVVRAMERSGIKSGRQTTGRFGQMAAYAVIVLTLVVSGFLLYQRSREAQPEQARTRPAESITQTTAPAASGTWTASVKYDWGSTHAESFTFEVHGGELSGTAGFLGRPRGITDGKVKGDRITFVTSSLTMTGADKDPVRDQHFYEGTINGDQIQFTMRTESSVSDHEPIRFTATRSN